VIWKRGSFGLSLGCQTSCCSFFTLSFKLPVLGEMSKVAGRSSVTNSPSLVRFVCALAGKAAQVESPISAARRVTPQPEKMIENLNCTLPFISARALGHTHCSQPVHPAAVDQALVERCCPKSGRNVRPARTKIVGRNWFSQR